MPSKYDKMKTLKRIVLNFYLPLTLIFTQSVAQLTFVHISDLHVSTGTSYVNNSDINGVVLSQMLSTINGLSPKPAFVVASGDISNVGNAGDGMYSVLTQFLYPSNVTNPGNGDLYIDSSETIPIYFVPGNHEYYTTLIPPLSSSPINNYVANVAPAADYFITYNNAVLIFMLSGYDAFRPIWQDPNITEPEGSGLSNAQITWLRNVLANNAGKRKIIIMHHPPVNAHGTNADGSPNTGTILDTADGSILNNRTEFLNICDSNHVDIVLAGHVHQNLVADRPGNVVSENWTGGTRYIQTAACMYKAYRIITIDSSFISVGPPQILTTVGIQDYASTAGDNSIKIRYDASQKMLTVTCFGFTDPSDGALSIYNIMGQQVLNQKLSIIDGKQAIINTGAMPAGLYLLTIGNGKSSIAKKVMIY